jgi:hypothetical protein
MLLGETGWETDTLKTKLGDGVTTWNGLAYDAGSVAQANVLATLASASTGQGAQLIPSLPFYTVLGLDPTGSTDDTSLFAAAIAALPGGGIIKIPFGGVYRITAPLVLHSGLIIEGTGSTNQLYGTPGTAPKPTYIYNSAGTPIFQWHSSVMGYDCDNVTIRDMVLAGYSSPLGIAVTIPTLTAPTAVGAYGIDIQITGNPSMINTHIERVRFLNLDRGISIVDPNADTQTNGNVSGFTIKNCDFFFCNSGVYLYDDFTDLVQFDSCYFQPMSNQVGANALRSGLLTYINCWGGGASGFGSPGLSGYMTAGTFTLTSGAPPNPIMMGQMLCGFTPTATTVASGFAGYLSSGILHLTTLPTGGSLSPGDSIFGFSGYPSGIYIVTGSGSTWMTNNLTANQGSSGSPVSGLTAQLPILITGGNYPTYTTNSTLTQGSSGSPISGISTSTNSAWYMQSGGVTNARHAVEFRDCQVESATSWLLVTPLASSDTLDPITMHNCFIEAPVTINQACHFVSKHGVWDNPLVTTTGGVIIDSELDAFYSGQGFELYASTQMNNFVPHPTYPPATAPSVGYPVFPTGVTAISIQGGKRFASASSQPSVNYPWSPQDICWNTAAPGNGQPLGWSNVSNGGAGVWTAFYAIPAYATGTWTPTLTGFTIVNGTGSIIATGEYTQIGNVLSWNVTISGTGTATVASVAGTSKITGIPVSAGSNNGLAQTGNYAQNFGNSQLITNTIYTPVWSAVTPASTGSIIISGTAFTS